jgi:hypothetical protein
LSRFLSFATRFLLYSYSPLARIRPIQAFPCTFSEVDGAPNHTTISHLADSADATARHVYVATVRQNAITSTSES